MTVTEKILYQYGDIKRRINCLEAQLNDITFKKEAVCRRLLEAKPVYLVTANGGPPSDLVLQATENLSHVYAERIDRVAKDLAEANNKLASIEDMISNAKLDETEIRYVRLRYFDGLPVWRVEQKLGYSERQTRRLKETLLGKMKMEISH